MTTITTLPNAIWCSECRSIRNFKSDDGFSVGADPECPFINAVDYVCSEGHVVTTVYTDRRLHV